MIKPQPEDKTNLELINACKGEFIDPLSFAELEMRGVPVDWHNQKTDLLATRYETISKENFQFRIRNRQFMNVLLVR